MSGKCDYGHELDEDGDCPKCEHVEYDVYLERKHEKHSRDKDLWVQ